MGSDGGMEGEKAKWQSGQLSGRPSILHWDWACEMRKHTYINIHMSIYEETKCESHISPEEKHERLEEVAEVVVALEGGARVQLDVAEELHADDGVDEEQHEHEQPDVRQSLELNERVLVLEMLQNYLLWVAQITETRLTQPRTTLFRHPCRP